MSKTRNLIDLNPSPQVGLNPDATLEHPGSEAAHIGLKAGKAVIDFAIDDAFNQVRCYKTFFFVIDVQITNKLECLYSANFFRLL